MSKRRKKTYFEESLIANKQSYQRYFNQLLELAIGCWRWNNLPDTVDERTIEYVLARNGQALYFRDEVIGDLCLEFTCGGQFDVYGYPLLRRAYSYYNQYHTLRRKGNSVVIYNNNIRTNTFYAINQFATRLYMYDRIIDVNVNAQKTPVALTASENQRLTIENAYKDYDGNAPVILLGDKFDPNAFGVLKTDAPFNADKIWYMKQQIWNDALTFLGIRNVNNSKKERMITAEVDIANIDADYNHSVKLACRRHAAEQINKMFGTDITVDFIGDEIISQTLAGNEQGKVRTGVEVNE